MFATRECPEQPQILKLLRISSSFHLSPNASLLGAADVEQSTTFGRSPPPPQLVLVLPHKPIKFDAGDNLSVVHWAASLGQSFHCFSLTDCVRQRHETTPKNDRICLLEKNRRQQTASTRARARK